MHNLYLKIWKDNGVLRPEHFDVIQDRHDEMNIPQGIGRVPNKIHSKFSGLTADQWRNWTNLFSLYALHDILPPDHYLCWSKFVQASVIFCQYSITFRDINLADKKLMEFCKMFEELYGEDKCTPNMHLHGHLRDCILNYGPLSSFWVFAFERYNGVLESFVNNWMTPEQQMMTKFLSYQELIGSQLLCNIDEGFSGAFDLCLDKGTHTVGAMQHHMQDGILAMIYSKNATCNIHNINAVLLPFQSVNNSRVFERYFSEYNLSYLCEVYLKLYPTSDYTVTEVPRKHFVFSDITVLGERYLSLKSRSQRSTVILAYWCDSGGSISTTMDKCMAGRVEYFFTHTCTISISTDTSGSAALPPHKKEKIEHVFAKVKWFGTHPRTHHFHYPLLLVTTVYENEGPGSIIPLSRIICRCGISTRQTVQFDYGEDSVYIISPYFQKQILTPW